MLGRSSLETDGDNGNVIGLARTDGILGPVRKCVEQGVGEAPWRQVVLAFKNLPDAVDAEVVARRVFDFKKPVGKKKNAIAGL